MTFCALVVIIAAVGVLAGWYFDIAFLKTLVPDFPTMKPNSAVAFALAGAGLLCAERSDRGRFAVYASVIFGFGVALIGLLTLGQYVSGLSVRADSLLMPASSISGGDDISGRIPLHAAFNFIGLGISIVFLSGNRLQRRLSEMLCVLVSLSSFFAMLGYIYQAEHMSGVTRYNSMAVHGIALFFVCSFGLLAANKSSKLLVLLTSDSLGGTAARTLVPPVILIPTVIQWLQNIGQESGLFGPGFGTALSIMVSVVLMLTIVLSASFAMQKVDQRRKLVEGELIEKEGQYRELFDYSQGMICIHDLRGMLLTVNPATLRSLGYEREEIVGFNLAQFLPAEQRSGIGAFLREIESAGLSNGLLPLMSKSGAQVVWRYHSILVSNLGKEPYVIGHAQDVTELIEAQKQLKNLSLTDDLTGLYNRRGFLAMAEQQIKLERHEKTARGLTLMFADMDGLKKINDVHGHAAGSDAIIALAGIINSALRSADLVARWGGDEFVIMTIGSQDEDADVMSDRIARRIVEYNAVSGKPYDLACSIGIAPIPLDGTRPLESVIAEADKAMYTEKQRRKAMDGVTPPSFPNIPIDTLATPT